MSLFSIKVLIIWITKFRRGPSLSYDAQQTLRKCGVKETQEQKIGRNNQNKGKINKMNIKNNRLSNNWFFEKIKQDWEALCQIIQNKEEKNQLIKLIAQRNITTDIK